ncbi:MAG: HAD hydrolase family protein [Candidatus Kapaibacterium sp.]|jgi:N-acylneuraminate cytidylyltransferase|nr:HAD hydrolase family protein [Candidatus Kapabacteria bacterium]
MIAEAEIINKLSKIKMLVMDVDGTLTDSAMYFSANGEELKRFSTRDGMGITLLHRNNIMTAIITSEDSPIVTARATKLKINHVVLGCHDKSSAIKEIAGECGIDLSEIAFIGDDINDEPVMKIVGFSACPSDSVQIIKNTANFVCNFSGGNGAVREFAEMILLSQNKLINIQEQW